MSVVVYRVGTDNVQGAPKTDFAEQHELYKFWQTPDVM